MLEGILLAGGLLLFLAMLFKMQDSLQESGFVNPILLGAAAVMLLWPIREQRPTRALMLTGGAALLFWLMLEVSTVLAPFIVVFLLAYLFNPLSTKLEERFNIPRWTSSLVVTLLIVGITVLFFVGLVPSLYGQVETLAIRTVNGMEQFDDWMRTSATLDRFEAAGLIQKDQFIDQITSSIHDLAGSVADNLPVLAGELVRHLSSIFAIITIAAVVPVLLFYTIKDFPFIKARIEELLPTFGGRRDYLVNAGQVVGSYIRGQLTISAIAIFNVTIALLLFDVPFALLIGLITGVFNLIPNLGAIISTILGMVLAFMFGDSWMLDVTTVFLVLTGQNLLEQSVLTPKIMSDQVGLHPVLILLSLFVFSYVLGLVGLLIAVPATALLMTVYRAYREDLVLDLSPEARLKRDLAKKLKGRAPRSRAEESADTA